MDIRRFYLCFLPLWTACSTEVVNILETPDAGSSASADASSRADTGARQDTGVFIDAGVLTDAGDADGGIWGDASCPVPGPNLEQDAIDYDGARAAPLLEARGDQLVLLREGHYVRHDTFTAEAHRYPLFGPGTGVRVLHNFYFGSGLETLTPVGEDFGVVVPRQEGTEFGFKMGVIADGMETIVTATSSNRRLGAATMTSSETFFTTHLEDDTRHVVHARGIFDPSARDIMVVETHGFAGYAPKLHRDGDEVWLTILQDWDFPTSVVLIPVSGASPDLATIWAFGCGVNSYDVTFFGPDWILTVTDCGQTTTLNIYRKGDPGPSAVVEVTAEVTGDAVRVPSRVATDGERIGVLIWRQGRPAPELLFYDISGARIGDALSIPAPAEGPDVPVGMDLTGVVPSSGVARWAVASTYRTNDPSEPGTTHLTRFDLCAE